MCATSAVTDYYQHKWHLPNYREIPEFPSPAPFVITPEQWAEYRELKKRMEEYDKNTNQPDCVKPQVAIWELGIESMMKGTL